MRKGCLKMDKEYKFYQDLYSVVDKVAIVTGASQGLGREAAIGLAKAGAKIVLCARNIESLKATEQRIHEVSGIETLVVECDVSRKSDIDNVIEKTIEKFGQIDILVNNAGIGSIKSFFDYTEEEYDRIMDVNLKGMFFFSQGAARYMKKRHYGKIINIASINAHGASRCNPVYVSSKGGVLQMTKALGNDLIKYGINVNAISPGLFIPEEMCNIPEITEKINYCLTGQPMKRIGKMDELVGATIYLASDASSYCVGTDILVDGGVTALLYENPPLYDMI